MHHSRTFLTAFINIKRLPSINYNSELSLGLPLHQRNLFLLNIKFFKNYIKRKDVTQKNELHNIYKIYRKLISALIKRSEQNYYSKYFENNLTNIENTWKGITNIFSMKSSSLVISTLLTFKINLQIIQKRLQHDFQ